MTGAVAVAVDVAVATAVVSSQKQVAAAQVVAAVGRMNSI